MGQKSYDSVIPMRGLNTSVNRYLAPDGSQTNDSWNWMLRRPGVLETRNPVERLAIDGGTTTTFVDKMFAYKNDLYCLRSTADLRRYDIATNTYSGILATISGVVANDLKMRSAVAGERLFLTTNTGPICVDSDTVTYARAAGGPTAPGVDTAQSGLSGGSGFLGDDKQVAYRYLLGAYINDIEVLGAVSPRYVIANESGSTDSVDLGLALDTELDPNVDYFIRVFRSAQSDLTVPPDDDLRVVYEAQITPAQAAAALVEFVDDCADTLRGAFIYTAPNAGEGILQNNYKPPLLAELCPHKDRLWGARSLGKHELTFSVIGVGGSTGIQAGDLLQITGLSLPMVASASPLSGNDYLLQTGGSVSQNIEATAQSLVATINRVSIGDGGVVWAEYASGPDNPPGMIRIYKVGFSTQAFQVTVGINGTVFSKRFGFSPRASADLVTSGFSLARVTNVVTATHLGGKTMANALAVGDSVTLNSPTGTFGAGPHTVTAVSGATFSYAETAINATNAGPLTYSDAALTSMTSIQETRDHRVWFSKFREFEAFPLLNFFDIGRSDKKVLALKATSETLWVFKEDGLFRIFGDDETNFGVEHVDETIQCLSAETIQLFDNRVFAWTNKGVVALDSGSIEYLSKEIDPTLRDIVNTYISSAAQPLNQCFAIAHELDGWYAIFWPDSAINSTPSAAGFGGAYVWFREAKQWCRWRYVDGTDPKVGGACFPISCGVYNPVDTKYYLADKWNVPSVEGSLYGELRDPTVVNWAEPGNFSQVGINVMQRSFCVAWQHGKAPFREKRWDEVAVLTENFMDFNGTLTFGFGNENSAVSGASVFSSATSNQDEPSSTLRITPPTDYGRSQRLEFIFVARILGECTLAGFGIQYEVLSPAIRR